MTFISLVKKFLLIVLVSVMMIGCTDDPKDNINTNTKSIGAGNTGQFLDDAVSGLGYATESLNGTTNYNGEFEYEDGGLVTFSIGNIILGSSLAKSVITPLDLVPGATDYTNPAVINIIRLLQTLDIDELPANGIEISPSATSAATIAINFNVNPDLFELNPDVIDFITAVTGKSQLIATKTAVQHFQQTLAKIENTDAFILGGQVFGLSGNLNIQYNGIEAITLTEDGAFSFTTLVPEGSGYTITITDQPTGQLCSISNGVGSAVNADVSSVLITCSSSGYRIGGAVSGLSGTLEIQNNNSDSTVISTNGSFSFASLITSGSSYDVQIVTQPTGQTCTITNGSGTNIAADISTVNILCSINSYTVGGNVSGLMGTVVLQNNSGDDLTLSANGTFTFASAISEGTSYDVRVLSQPAGQTCSVINGTGSNVSATVTGVAVNCSMNSYTIGGNISGLTGSIVLQNNDANNLTASSNGSFTFTASVLEGNNYNVTILAQPFGQTCAVSSASGTNVISNITTINVSCMNNTYSIGGAVSGLTDTVVLQNNGGDTLFLTANGSFAFPSLVLEGSSYDITILSQPSGQTCAVSSGSGSSVTANITSVNITCSSNTYSIGGSVSGLTGSVVLQNNGGGDLTVSSNGVFTFASPLPEGASYTVTVLTQPTSQTCTVSSGSGSSVTADITTVIVSCTTNTYSIGGTISGLAGSVILQNNSGDNLTVSSNGTFAFATPITEGASYAVTVFTQPVGQTCSVSSGSGSSVTTDVTSVSVICTTNTYSVSGSVSGLTGGALVLQNNGGDDYTTTTNRPFLFSTEVPYNGSYNVSVLLPQPTGQTCTVTSGSGSNVTADITTVNVNCTTNTYTIGGTVSGLSGTVVLQNNTSENLTINADGTFTFPTEAPYSSGYAVTVLTQPTGQVCTVSNGTGTNITADITSVNVNCAINTYTIGGSVSGLSGTVVLQNNAGDDLTIATNGSFTFSGTINEGGSYDVTVLTRPSSQSCTITNSSGTGVSANVSTVSVSCSDNLFTVGGSVSGLIGSVVLQNNGSDNRSISTDGTFTFSTSILEGSPFNVTVLTQPAGQTCSVVNGTGAGITVDVTTVSVTCSATTYTIGGNISGLVGTVTLQNSGANDLVRSSNGIFTFTAPVAEGGGYSVTVLTQPANQICSVANASGAGVTTNITSVAVTCVNAYTIGGAVSGLVGSITLQNNLGNDLTISANGVFTFTIPITQGSPFEVSVLNDPASQTCIVTNGSSTSVTANVTNVSVNCTTDTFSIGGTISGLTPGNTLVLQNNDGNNYTTTANGTFTFSTEIPYDTGYNVSVLLPQPTGQTCTVTSGSGTNVTADVTTVNINCTTNTYSIGGTISGLTGGTLVLQNNGANDYTTTANGTFTFSTEIPYDAGYNVSVLLPQPTGQTCTVTSGTGTNVTADVATVNVNCTTNTYSIEGTISGLTSGTLVLQNNGGDNYTTTVNGTFAFSTEIPYDGSYNVTVLLPHPVGQTCVVTDTIGTDGVGSNITADVNNIRINCSPIQINISGTISGHTGDLVLQNNGTNNLPLTSTDTTFNFVIDYNTGYAVTVLTPPTGQTCTVTDILGTDGVGSNITADVNNISINCSPIQINISGTISGHSGVLVLQNNAANNLPLTSTDTTFNFVIDYNTGYAVTVLTPPTGQTCTVTDILGTDGVGSNITADVNNISIDCSPIQINISGTISGHTGALVLQNNGTNNLPIATTDATFNFVIDYDTGYAVTVLTSPIGQTCSVTDTLGTDGIGSNITADVNNISIDCSPIQINISGTISGHTGALVLQNNGANNLPLTSTDTTFNFVIDYNTGYAITVLTPPTGQTCSVTSGSDFNVTADVINVEIACNYFIEVNVTGFTSVGETLGVNLVGVGSTPLSFTPGGATTQTFSATPFNAGDPYSVDITSAPTGQICSIDAGISFPRPILVDDVTSRVVNITCIYTVGVTVTGLSTSAAALLSVSLDGETTPFDVIGLVPTRSHTFTMPFFNGNTFTVRINDQPNEVDQYCSIQNPTPSTPTELINEPIAGASVVVDILCIAKESIVNLTYDECALPLFNNAYDTECGNWDVNAEATSIVVSDGIVNTDGIVDNADTNPNNDTGLLACIKAKAAENGWEYVLDVKVIDCSTPLLDRPILYADQSALQPNFRDQADIRSKWLVDDPRPDFLNRFQNLEVLDLGRNPLRQINPNFYNLKEPGHALKLPEIRYIETLDNDRFPTINLKFTVNGIHKNNLPETDHPSASNSIRWFVDVDGVTYNNLGGEVNRFNVNTKPTFFSCDKRVPGSPTQCDCIDADGDNICEEFTFTASGYMWGFDLEIADEQFGGQVCTTTPNSYQNVDEFGGGNDDPFGNPISDTNYPIQINCNESVITEINTITDTELKDCLINETETNGWRSAGEVLSANCQNYDIGDFSSLADFPALESVALFKDASGLFTNSDLAFFTRFAQLKSLSLENNGEPLIDNLEPIRILTNLTYLSIRGGTEFMRATHVTDILTPTIFPDANLRSCLSSIGGSWVVDVKDIDCSNFNISDLTGLERLFRLETLNLYNNNIINVTPIANLTIHPLLLQSPLRTLNLANNSITDISSLSQLPYLENVNLSGNSNIADIPLFSGTSSNARQMSWIDSVSESADYRKRKFSLQVTTPGQLMIRPRTIGDIPPEAISPYPLIEMFDITGSQIFHDSRNGLNEYVFTLPGARYTVIVNEDSFDSGSIEIDVSGTGTTPGVARFVANISALDLARNNLVDVTPVSELGLINYLDLSDNISINSDISIFSQLPNLGFLDLTNNANIVSGGALVSTLVLTGVNLDSGGVEQDAFRRPNVFTSQGPGGFLVAGSSSYSIEDTTDVILYPAGAIGNDINTGAAGLVTGKTVSSSFNVDLSFAGTRVDDYIITLTSPSGTTVTLCARNCSLIGSTFGVYGNFPDDFTSVDFTPLLGEPLEGIWTLFIDDQVVDPGDPGDALEAWAISN